MSERFANRTMIVTGGSYGIGAAVTQLFLREGARVVVVARGTRNQIWSSKGGDRTEFGPSQET